MHTGMHAPPTPTQLAAGLGPCCSLLLQTDLYKALAGKYEAVMIPDDDLLMSTHVVNTVFTLVAQYGLVLAQPSVCRHANSFTWITSSYQQPGNLLRFTAMVEIMVGAGQGLDPQPLAINWQGSAVWEGCGCCVCAEGGNVREGMLVTAGFRPGHSPGGGGGRVSGLVTAAWFL